MSVSARFKLWLCRQRLKTAEAEYEGARRQALRWELKAHELETTLWNARRIVAGVETEIMAERRAAR
ncbi:hypothetical protein SAMN02949497_3453 [Methylomagnum ishizawai]|uniref:Uncharacterized protein n=1 Tax=Methylomagnum ishizawai TaxID=1760988 RepID=A0A1Y6D6A5_9GAMM|nr:hypothetical protein [Methylomagnum ishizawai]SMF96072.1 hypothetical protein SAMN02949497_3453 [Methylomagnum ishizawai]